MTTLKNLMHSDDNIKELQNVGQERSGECPLPSLIPSSCLLLKSGQNQACTQEELWLGAGRVQVGNRGTQKQRESRLLALTQGSEFMLKLTKSSRSDPNSPLSKSPESNSVATIMLQYLEPLHFSILIVTVYFVDCLSSDCCCQVPGLKRTCSTFSQISNLTMRLSSLPPHAGGCGVEDSAWQTDEIRQRQPEQVILPRGKCFNSCLPVLLPCSHTYARDGCYSELHCDDNLEANVIILLALVKCGANLIPRPLHLHFINCILDL